MALLGPDAAKFGDPPLVLVVEDEFLILLNTVEDLNECGYWTIEASSGAEAIAAAKVAGAALRVALIDLGLPDRSGEAVAEELRSMTPGVRILFATGQADSELRQRYASDTNVGFLDKPYTRGTLTAQLVRLGVDAYSKG